LNAFSLRSIEKKGNNHHTRIAVTIIIIIRHIIINSKSLRLIVSRKVQSLLVKNISLTFFRTINIKSSKVHRKNLYLSHMSHPIMHKTDKLIAIVEIYGHCMIT
jgi:hypothetical protein